jgi:hypothetical protein
MGGNVVGSRLQKTIKYNDFFFTKMSNTAPPGRRRDDRVEKEVPEKKKVFYL